MRTVRHQLSVPAPFSEKPDVLWVSLPCFKGQKVLETILALKDYEGITETFMLQAGEMSWALKPPKGAAAVTSKGSLVFSSQGTLLWTTEDFTECS